MCIHMFMRCPVRDCFVFRKLSPSNLFSVTNFHSRNGINMSLNVDGSSDAFYRYKMAPLVTKVEGKGNGVKTVLTNICDIAKALGRKAEYPTKYFAMELGAQSRIDLKNDRYIINGIHDSKKLQELLQSFIERFVLCESCNNPETVQSVKGSGKRGSVVYRCRACGHNGELSAKHKLCQYITKNPPEDVELTVDKDSEDKERENDEPSDNEGALRAASDDDFDAPPELDEAALAEAGQQWTVEDATDRCRMIESLNEAAKRLVVINDEDHGNEGWKIKTIDERVEEFSKLIFKFKAAKDGGDAQEAFSGEAIDKLVKAGEVLDLQDKAILVLLELLLVNPVTLDQDVIQYADLMRQFTVTPIQQRMLLSGICLIIDTFHEKLLSKTSAVLNQFYQNDLLYETSVLEWHAKGPSKRLINKARSKELFHNAVAFIDWLKTAEVESSDDECVDDEGGDVDDAAPMADKTDVTKVLDEEGSDVDVDDI